MADYREILHERLYVKVPGTDTLRKTAANRQKHLLANGWRELERQQRADHVMVTFERTGHAPMKARLPKQVRRGAHRASPPSRRQPRRRPPALSVTGPKPAAPDRSSVTGYPSVLGVFHRTFFGYAWVSIEGTPGTIPS